MDSSRLNLYKQIEEKRDSKLIVYVTGDRQNFGTQIAHDAIDYFVEHLDLIGTVPKISLLLYTSGGLTLAAWNIVRLIRQFCKDFEVIVPFKAHSSGTLICLGANRIVMTKQATLSPIDQSFTRDQLHPLGVPVNSEALRGFFDLARYELGIKDETALSSILNKLTDNVHPLTLGDCYRSMNQTQTLAEKLLTHQVKDPDKTKTIISFLCSDAGSHDYPINWQEASELGLSVEKPDQELYQILKKTHNSIRDELGLHLLYCPASLTGENEKYKIHRVLIESISGGADAFLSEGTFLLNKEQNSTFDMRLFDGWKHNDFPK